MPGSILIHYLRDQSIQPGKFCEGISPLLHPQLLTALIKLHQVGNGCISKINPQIQEGKSSFAADLQCR